jgi:hypothetical protein
METLQLTEAEAIPGAKRKDFWRRQFRPEVTTTQIGFDLALGVIAPILCYVFDPIVFRGGFGAPLFPDYQAFTYLLSGAQIAVLVLWLVVRPQHHIGGQMIGGALLTGAVFCLVVGLVLSPFSLMGLMFGIGIFGFTPFLTAFVYLRNAVRGTFPQISNDRRKRNRGEWRISARAGCPTDIERRASFSCLKCRR